MLFDMIIRIGYILQMVKDIPRILIVVSQYNVHSLDYSGNDVSVGSNLPKELLLRVCTYCLTSTVLRE